MRVVSRRQELCPDTAAERIRAALRPLLCGPITMDSLFGRFDTPRSVTGEGGERQLDLPPEFELVMTRKTLSYDRMRLGGRGDSDVFTFTLGIKRTPRDPKLGYTEGIWRYHCGPSSGKSTRELTEGRNPRKYPGWSESHEGDDITASAEFNAIFPPDCKPFLFLSNLQNEILHVSEPAALYGCERGLRAEVRALKRRAEDAAKHDHHERRWVRHYDRLLRMLKNTDDSPYPNFFAFASRIQELSVAGLHVAVDAGFPVYGIGMQDYPVYEWEDVGGVHAGAPTGEMKVYPVYTQALELLRKSTHNVNVAALKGYALNHVSRELKKQCGIKLRNP